VTAQAEHARVAGTVDAAADAWASAVSAWERAAQPYRQAYAEWRHADALLTVGDRHGARSTLRDAHLRSERVGARLVHSDVVALARRARLDITQVVSGQDRPANPHNLTPREQQILGMLVEGRTNRQIAKTLFVSHRTVGTHVSNLLAKLDAGTRSEAAAIAHRERLV
jgi:DNA-binding NarL/FixJ family response regulator